MSRSRMLFSCSKLVVMAALCAVLVAPQAQAREWKEYETKKYGYALKLPAEFTIQEEDKTTSWIYQPGSAPAGKSEKKGLKKKLGINIKGVGASVEESSESSSESSGGGLESALMVYINWVWMPDVSSDTMFKTNMDSDKKNMSSPDPDYTDLIVFDKKKGYAYEGNTYWYKEVDKTKGDEIHRWHIKAYGNQSAYTIGLTGTYAQFKEWAPVYEEVIKSFRLIPLEK